MRRVRVVTDSTADLPLDAVVRWGIQVVPLKLHFGEQSFRDGLDLPPEVFYERLEQGEFPLTSQPAMGEFRHTYERIAAGGGEVISIHLSAGLSGTVQAALLAAEQVDGEVAVVDSGQLSMALGWLVLAAAELARQDLPLDQVVARVEEMRSRTHVLALIDSLEFLRRGGRVGRAQAALGALLDVQPILTLRGGQTTLLERVRTRQAGRRRLIELVAGLAPLERVAVLHANNPDLARQLADDLAPLFPREQILLLPAGQVVTTHVGPGAVGVALVQGP
ncbi:MAG: DegV family protein [Chloroflexia bacterium]|nr:DegV family protein [Chloroflexia bacterium]